MKYLKFTSWAVLSNGKALNGPISFRLLSTRPIELTSDPHSDQPICILGNVYQPDNWTNVTRKIIGLSERKLHMEKYNPICLVKNRIIDYFHRNYRKRYGTSPLFTVVDSLSPIVSVWQNFDSLLVPPDHPSRRPSDSYYINSENLFRAHTSAHQHDMIGSGLDAFLVVGDVYRRDQIDRHHFPVFHQMEGVCLFSQEDLFPSSGTDLKLFESEHSNLRKETGEKQEKLTMDASKLVEHNLKSCLEGLSDHLFGFEHEKRWVPSEFPFTHPSFELEINDNGNWLEVLGCGVMRQDILEGSGAGSKVGWAFGLGLERLAMRLYNIPDIRLFWSKDTGFLHQFITDDPNKTIEYKPISRYPQCTNDLSFWLPPDSTRPYHSHDFYDMVRDIGGDLVEQVHLVDDFVHPKTGRRSHCYRIVYRHMERTLKQSEVNDIHRQIEQAVSKVFGGEVR